MTALTKRTLARTHPMRMLKANASEKVIHNKQANNLEIRGHRIRLFTVLISITVEGLSVAQRNVVPPNAAPVKPLMHMEAEEVRQHIETIQKEDMDRAQWLQVLSPNTLVSDQSLISAKKLLTAYSEAVHSLKNAVTDAKNQKIASRVLSEKNEELHLKLEGLQRSIVCGTPY
ncbi:hypothetical protein SLS60_007185 [Paraconiothyrium brasiliense]|uniref:Uncharacterized protein n=1 Tax=Paraconiothyrium brasiliense TaxID=300254 RepID=A0ABR3R8V9_9PLEO